MALDDEGDTDEEIKQILRRKKEIAEVLGAARARNARIARGAIMASFDDLEEAKGGMEKRRSASPPPKQPHSSDSS